MLKRFSIFFLASFKTLCFYFVVMNATATLHFHSFKDKRFFIKRNKITTSEIILETPASITINNGFDFVNSPFVYQVTPK